MSEDKVRQVLQLLEEAGAWIYLWEAVHHLCRADWQGAHQEGYSCMFACSPPCVPNGGTAKAQAYLQLLADPEEHSAAPSPQGEEKPWHGMAGRIKSWDLALTDTQRSGAEERTKEEEYELTKCPWVPMTMEN
ncbi:hypothetical protein NDU88_004785 [Pleurodeles waltl]|uniref:Uncharacterized protein n=1 Tax=Pleurodeles waltl TaxID=8319 RepID=A0AAV7PGP5_PLEWA|nr:hypothetical protein NDU88_004785 [Pleurodeles waltl]